MGRTRKTQPSGPETALFGARLTELRKKRGLTIEELKNEAGMSFTFISDMERGVKVPSLTTLIRLAAALRCKVADLVRTIDAEDPQSLIPKRK